MTITHETTHKHVETRMEATLTMLKSKPVISLNGTDYSIEGARAVIEVLQLALGDLKEEPEDDEEWILWSGGECPVPKDTRVQIKLRDGSMHMMEAIYFAWNHNNCSGDIIAYRIIKDKSCSE